MKKYYVIVNVIDGGFWSDYDKRFRGFLWATKFKTEEQLLAYATKEKIKTFTITTIFETE